MAGAIRVARAHAYVLAGCARAAAIRGCFTAICVAVCAGRLLAAVIAANLAIAIGTDLARAPRHAARAGALID